MADDGGGDNVESVTRMDGSASGTDGFTTSASCCKQENYGSKSTYCKHYMT
jgi:hypothetical protein